MKVFSMLLFIICIFAISCRSKMESQSKYFHDFSLVDGVGLKSIPLDSIEYFNDQMYIEVKGKAPFPDEIILHNYKRKGGEKRILCHQKEGIKIYKPIPLSVNNDALYWCYKDSIFKRYTFGLQLGDEKGPITGAYSNFKNDGYINVYHILINQKDTVNFVDKAWYLDTVIQRTDSNRMKWNVNPFVLSNMISWEWE